MSYPNCSRCWENFCTCEDGHTWKDFDIDHLRKIKKSITTAINWQQSQVFVFGSNLAGRHGKGSALRAKQEHGAIQGKGTGFQGRSYAIPTKDESLNVLPLSKIEEYVDEFINFAIDNRQLTFNVVKIGCGLAGYQEEQIKPMFANAPSNVNLPEGW